MIGGRRSAVVLALLVACVTIAMIVRGRPGGGPPARTGTTQLPAAGRRALGLLVPRVSPGPPALPAPRGLMLGANVNRLFNDPHPAAQINASLRTLAATGATDARTDALWEAAEPAPPLGGRHHYDWRFADRIAGSLAAHRLRWLPIIDYTPPWVQSIPGQDHSEPSSAAAYAAYAAAFTARYGSGGTFWRTHPQLPPEPVEALEIWNEPDGGHFWLPGPDAPGYGNLYASARAAVKLVDPGIRVLVGGLTNPPLFLAVLLGDRPDLRGHIDGVAIHPYGANPKVVLGRMAQARAVLQKLGLGSVPLYATEFGWSIRPAHALDHLPARLRPRFISATLTALARSGCGIAGAFLYNWQSPERDPRQGEDWFGIHPPGGGSSPSQRAFAAGVRAASARSPAPLAGTRRRPALPPAATACR